MPKSLNSESVRLTSLSHGAGCACKIGAAELASLLEPLPQVEDPNLLVGATSSDDAAIYRLRDDLAIVATADFFTPIVDDPYDFGRVAAANALSDIYAMGAEPLLALNLVGFSLAELGERILQEILRGGAEIAEQAGAAIAGGHSIDDPEPKYGMAAIGTAHPNHVLTNAGAQAGDLLFLTKALGVGLITTAAKRGVASEDLVARAIEVVIELNSAASRAALSAGAHGVTDVTGFGLLGHLHELCLASGVAATIEAGQVRAIEGALELAEDPRCIAGGSRTNRRYAEGFTGWSAEVTEARRVLLTDAMTSGGLLVAVPPDQTFHAADGFGNCIGRLGSGDPGAVTVI